MNCLKHIHTTIAKWLFPTCFAYGLVLVMVIGTTEVAWAQTRCFELFASIDSKTAPSAPLDMLMYLNKLESIRPDFAKLAGHPGLLQRLNKSDQRWNLQPLVQIITPGFIDFAKAILANQPNETPESVYEMYRNALGTTEIVRALVLAPEEVKVIQQKGMQPNSRRLGESMNSSLRRLSSQGLERLISLHTSFETVGDSPFMSASYNPEIAQWAAQVTLRENPTKRIYLFRIMAWKTDVIETPSRDEVLLFGSIPPSQITNIEEAKGFVNYRGRDY